MYQIFMSYPTLADRHGEITQFKEELEYRLMVKTGDPSLRIFQDKKDIALGEDWREKLNRTLDEAGFLIPMVQPLLFTSEWCQREVLEFDERCRAKGLEDRILSVVWEKTPMLNRGDPESTDLGPRVAHILSSRQWFDWSPWQLHDWSNVDKRLRLDDLAGQIAAALSGDKSTRRAAPAIEPARQVTPAVAREDASGKELTALLLSMFSASELRRLVRWMRDGDALSAALPGANASPMQVATDVVEVLHRSGALDASFFALLREERPRRVAEINAVAQRFGA